MGQEANSDQANASDDFHDAIIPADSQRLLRSRGLNLEDYTRTITETPRAIDLLKAWGALYREPFKGVTADGVVEKGLFHIADEGFDVAAAVQAAQKLLATLSDGERAKIQYAIDAPQWREWYNPEFLINTNGLRLDQAAPATREAAAGLMQASMSQPGYVKTAQTRSANLFLGELYDLRHIMNEWSYHFLLFGTPSPTEPWGWSLYGHHLSLNCFILGGQMVISPTFMGAEPAIIDRGPHDHFRLFEAEESGGLALMRSLSPELQLRATRFKQLKDPEMGDERWHFADERQLGAAFRDNRVIPLEGVEAKFLSSAQQETLLGAVESFIDYLPDGPRRARMKQVEAALDRTWFSWIGDHGEKDPFYFRIQSPILMVEFDHHCGVWLTNTVPKKYHIHTVVRTPNGNDYGKDLLRQHYRQIHQGGAEHEAPKPAHGHSHSHADGTHHSHDHAPHDHSH